jgi:hypothetical protein
MRTSLGRSPTSWSAKIASGDIGEIKVFQIVKTMVTQILRDLDRIEIAQPGFSERSRALRNSGYVGAAFEGIILERLGVIEHDLGSRQAADKLQYRGDGFFPQIRHYPEPTKECGLGRLKSGRGQLFSEVLAGEIHGGECECRGHGKTCLQHALTFPRLRRGMIDFEHPQGGVRISQRECIEPCPQNHNLAKAARNRRTQTILGKTAPGRDEYSHLPLGGISGNSLDKGIGLPTKNKAGDGIVENLGAVQGLVCPFCIDGSPSHLRPIASRRSIGHNPNTVKI